MSFLRALARASGRAESSALTGSVGASSRWAAGEAAGFSSQRCGFSAAAVPEPRGDADPSVSTASDPGRPSIHSLRQKLASG